MLRALLLPLMTLALAAMVTAQTNLVLNGSFEDTVFCSTPTQCTLLKAEHWNNPNLVTPDVYDCDLNRVCGSPMSPALGQAFIPALDGLRHAGHYYWDGPGTSDTREYLMTKLSEPLQAEALYEVSLWYARRRTFQYAIDHIGVWIGHDSIFEATNSRLELLPQIRLSDPLSSYLTNGEDWTQLKDTLLAVGGEQWMVIGNFDVSGDINGVLAEPSGWYSNCYYYIDNVKVNLLSETSIHEEVPQVWWNGTGLGVQWDVLPGPIQFTLWDASARVVKRFTAVIHSGRVDLAVSGLSDGLYILESEVRGRRVAVRFVKGEGAL